MSESILREIGLTDSEIKVYMTILDLGDSTKGKIVYKSGVTGSKIYEILERLHQKGLISIYLKEKIKHFKAANPKQILEYLEEKKNKIEDTEKQVNDILPNLMMKFSSSKKSQEVELFTGLKGLQAIFREQLELLKAGDTNYVIGGTKGSDEEAVVAFFQKIHMIRASKKINTKMLFNKRQKKATEESYSSYKYTQVKYIEHISPVAINIYADRTTIIVFGEEITAIMITSQEAADSFLEYFKMLWG